MKDLLRILILLVALIVLLMPSGSVMGIGHEGFLTRPTVGGNATSLQWVGGNVSSTSYVTVGRWVIPTTPDSYDFGVVAQSDVRQTGLTYFTITNYGEGTVSVRVGGTDMLGANSTWTLSNSASPGADVFGLYSGLSGGDYSTVVRKDASYNNLISSLGAGASRGWGLRIYTPTVMSVFETMAGNITLTLYIP
ncbi:hypothetical protein LCGC14_3014200 [marine sediment metagenome]|uniref:Uncharacterized protein n=1 Tax=marine sediment metagenome TaxID=412755 RepID=A0A0F8XK60_9ZZZZ